MHSFEVCQKCQGFVPPETAACVHCGGEVPAGRKVSRALRGLAAFAGMGLCSITLMACYGAPPINYCSEQSPDGGVSGDCYDLSDDRVERPDGGSDGGGR